MCFWSCWNWSYLVLGASPPSHCSRLEVGTRAYTSHRYRLGLGLLEDVVAGFGSVTCLIRIHLLCVETERTFPAGGKTGARARANENLSVGHLHRIMIVSLPAGVRTRLARFECECHSAARTEEGRRDQCLVARHGLPCHCHSRRPSHVKMVDTHGWRPLMYFLAVSITSRWAGSA